ncbi:MAG: hypothetical protein ACE5EI_01490 [Thermodesulfobacteriota bacterium]
MKSPARATLLIASALVLLAALGGCGYKVNYALTPEFSTIRPGLVAVAPVVWETDAAPEAGDVKWLFRAMSTERLTSLNYRALSIKEVDQRVRKAGARKVAEAAPADAARLLGVDAVLYIRVTGWDVDKFLTYASLSFSAAFELYSATGARVWTAEYSTRESDIRLDTETMELAVLQTYEPRLQRFVDAIFATLPPSEPTVTRERYFDWLP